MIHHLASVRMAIKMTTSKKYWQGCGEKESLYNAGWNVNWCSQENMSTISNQSSGTHKPLAIHFTYSNVYVSMLLFQFVLATYILWSVFMFYKNSQFPNNDIHAWRSSQRKEKDDGARSQHAGWGLEKPFQVTVQDGGCLPFPSLLLRQNNPFMAETLTVMLIIPQKLSAHCVVQSRRSALFLTQQE